MGTYNIKSMNCKLCIRQAKHTHVNADALSCKSAQEVGKTEATDMFADIYIYVWRMDELFLNLPKREGYNDIHLGARIRLQDIGDMHAPNA